MSNNIKRFAVAVLAACGLAVSAALAGSQNAADSSIAGRTTSTDGTADAAVLDMGYHYAT